MGSLFIINVVTSVTLNFSRCEKFATEMRPFIKIFWPLVENTGLQIRVKLLQIRSRGTLHSLRDRYNIWITKWLVKIYLRSWQVTQTTQNRNLWLKIAPWVVAYTVSHWATLFFTMTPVFLGGFVNFMYQWKREWILYRTDATLF